MYMLPISPQFHSARTHKHNTHTHTCTYACKLENPNELYDLCSLVDRARILDFYLL